jgi:hypothetical protein
MSTLFYVLNILCALLLARYYASLPNNSEQNDTDNN